MGTAFIIIALIVITLVVNFIGVNFVFLLFDYVKQTKKRALVTVTLIYALFEILIIIASIFLGDGDTADSYSIFDKIHSQAIFMAQILMAILPVAYIIQCRSIISYFRGEKFCEGS